MRRLRFRRPERSNTDLRSPRLIVRFTVFTGVGLAVAGACIFVLVRGFIVNQQEASVMSRARFVAQVVLDGQIRPSDFEQLSGRRVAQLDRLFDRRVLVDGLVRATLYSSSGRVTYSTSHALIGRFTPDSARALLVSAGPSIHSRRVNRVIGGRKQQILEEFVPIRFKTVRPTGALVLWTSYGPIAGAARNAFIPISLVLELLLVVLFLGLVPMLRRVTRQVRAHLAESQRRALHDELTGLPNRALFSQRLKLALGECARVGGETAVLLIDLDRFKEINDTLGHGSGDALLQEIASRLSEVVRECDTVARLGGDEFAILLSNTSLEGARAIAGRIVDATSVPFENDSLSLSVGASVGIALYPQHGVLAANLIKHADVAMYEAKRSGVGCAIYDPEADSHHADLLSLASELRLAIQRGEITTHYQPMVDLRTGRVEGMEALLRWNHPMRGLLTAGEFMPLAQQLGLVPALSEHALTLAIQQCREWQSQGTQLTIAVNLDMRSFMDPDLPTRVASLLTEYDLDPRWLELEITETSLIGDQERVRQIASELTAIGVKLAIDDFAAGYTSLRYLVQLPVSKLKIDRSLVLRANAEPERVIITGIIDIAHNLGLSVVAEGIEDERTLELMRDLESDFAQGYHLGKPSAAPALHRPMLRAVRTA